VSVVVDLNTLFL